METLADLISDIKSEFGKSSVDLEQRLERRITVRLRELCSDFPYWFNRIDPGVLISAGFPYTEMPDNFGAGRWVDQGWFVTTPGVDHYPIALPYGAALDNEDDRLWTYPEVSRLNWVRPFCLQGGWSDDLEITNSGGFFARSQGYSTDNSGGAPCAAFLQTDTSGVSYLRLTPRPDKEYLIAVSYQLGVPPWFTSGEDKYNWLSLFFPRVLSCLAGIVYAKHYHEINSEMLYQKELYGDTDSGLSRSDIPNTGLVGKMKRDTIARHSQDDEEMGYYASKRESVGRGGSGGVRHVPGEPYYYG